MALIMAIAKERKEEGHKQSFPDKTRNQMVLVLEDAQDCRYKHGCIVLVHLLCTVPFGRNFGCRQKRATLTVAL